MNDSNATLAAYVAGLVLMLGYALTIGVSLARTCRTAPEISQTPSKPETQKAARTSEVKPPARVRASSR